MGFMFVGVGDWKLPLETLVTNPSKSACIDLLLTHPDPEMCLVFIYS